MTAPATLVAWIVSVTAMLMLNDPVVLSATAGIVVLLAVSERRWTLLGTALIAGLTMLITVPLAYRDVEGGASTVVGPFELSELALSSAQTYSLRLITVILLAQLLAVIDPTELLLAASRLSHRTALLGSLAVRAGPLIRRDAELASEELAFRGMPRPPRGSIVMRSRAGGRVAQSVLAGLFERSLATASVLYVRGFGASRADVTTPAVPRVHTPLVTVLTIASLAFASLLLLLVTVTPPMGVAQWRLAVAGLFAAVVVSAIAAHRLSPGGEGHHADPSPPVQVTSRGTGGAGICIEGLRVHRDGQERPALDIPHLTIPAGQLVLVAGPSGAGKSTLIGVLAGVVPELTGGVVSGVISIDGQDPSVLSASHRVRTVGLLGQDPELQAVMGTCAEEVALPLRAAGRVGSGLQQAVSRSLTAVNALHLAHRNLYELSSGELQRVELAAALACEPAVLLLDEPGSQLDSGSALQLRQRVQDRAAPDDPNRPTVIVAAHDVLAWAEIADRLIEIREGAVVRDVMLNGSGVERRNLVQSSHPSNPAPQRVMPVPGWQRLICDLAPGVQLRVPAGSVVAVVGENGAGKTTLLRQLAGLGPNPFPMSVDGHAVAPAQRPASAAWVPQNAGPNLAGATIAGIIHDSARLRGLAPVMADRAIAHAGLGELAHRHPMDCSVGERQRAAIAAATLHHPTVWLLDEPHRGLDTTARQWLAWLITTHVAAGGVVIAATHESSISGVAPSHVIECRWGYPPVVRGGAESVVVRQPQQGSRRPYELPPLQGGMA